jgi:hypothetical protein
MIIEAMFSLIKKEAGISFAEFLSQCGNCLSASPVRNAGISFAESRPNKLRKKTWALRGPVFCFLAIA